jgi:hypothetical protein
MEKWKEIKHFKEEEFYSPDLQECRMQYGFVRSLDRARTIAGIPFKINSGYRTPEHNRKVGGKSTSSHLKGLAADISCTSSSQRIKIVQGLIDSGFRRIGIADTFIHVDSDTDKSDAIWLYG